MNIKNCLVTKLLLVNDCDEEQNYFTTLVDNGQEISVYFNDFEPYFRDNQLCPYFACRYFNDPKEIFKLIKKLLDEKVTKIKRSGEFRIELFDINDIVKNSKIYKMDIDEGLIDINSKEFLSESLNPKFELIELKDFLKQEKIDLNLN